MVEFVQRDPGADVLVVTNMWPDEDRPVYGIYIQRQVEALRAAGVRCDVLYIRGYSSALAYVAAALRFAAATFTWRGRYKLVHVHTGEAALMARLFVGPRMLVTYCGDDVLGNRRADGSAPATARVRAAVVRLHAHLFDAVTTQSQEMHDCFSRWIQRRTTIVPGMGLDDQSFSPVDRDEAKRSLGWDLTERVVLFAATKPDSPAKRLWLAEQACAYAAERVGRVRLHIARSTPPEQMPIVMNAADCLIHTSAVEGGPIVIKEALMCNVPVVATAVGDAAESLEGVVPSYVCPPDPQALGDALVKCISTQSRSNGREAKAAWLSSAATTATLMGLYRRLAGELR